MRKTSRYTPADLVGAKRSSFVELFSFDILLFAQSIDRVSSAGFCICDLGIGRAPLRRLFLGGSATLILQLAAIETHIGWSNAAHNSVKLTNGTDGHRVS
jgi:hypothetical protein